MGLKLFIQKQNRLTNRTSKLALLNLELFLDVYKKLNDKLGTLFFFLPVLEYCFVSLFLNCSKLTRTVERKVPGFALTLHHCSILCRA